MFLTFETAREVKQVVSLLPKVGVGAHYNLPQTRCEYKNAIHYYENDWLFFEGLLP